MIPKLLFVPTLHQYLTNTTLPALEPKKEGITRIIAVGDSITFGSCSSDPDTKSYPSQLMYMLKDDTKFEVINLGLGGRTMMKTGDMPYWNE